jgi:Excalibur calcium-binding domain
VRATPREGDNMNTFLAILALAGIGAGLVGLRNGAVPKLRIANKRQAGVLLSGSLILGLFSIVPAASTPAQVPAVASSPGQSTSITPFAPASTGVVTVTATPTEAAAPTPTASVAPTTPSASPLPVVVVPATTSTSTETTTTSHPAPSTTTTEPAETVKVYARCSDLNVDYPHGVARTGGVDLVKGKPKSPQPRFTVDDAVYDANTARDGDGDGVACEQA